MTVPSPQRFPPSRKRFHRRRRGYGGQDGATDESNWKHWQHLTLVVDDNSEQLATLATFLVWSWEWGVENSESRDADP
jgi:hypothetical protein